MYPFTAIVFVFRRAKWRKAERFSRQKPNSSDRSGDSPVSCDECLSPKPDKNSTTTTITDKLNSVGGAQTTVVASKPVSVFCSVESLTN